MSAAAKTGLRLLHVHSGNLYGGVETALLSLARERNRAARLAPAYALCFDGRLAEELRALGAPVFILGAVRARNPFGVRRARRRLAELLAAERIDVAICHMAWAHAMFAPAVRRANRGLVFWMHDAANGRHWVERWAARVPPGLAICNSRYTAATMGKLFTRTRAEILCYPVAVGGPRLTPPERLAMRAELGARADDVAILQASRMEPWKGHELHLQALERLRDLPGWVCWIAGGAQRPHERDYRARLVAMTHQLGIADRVRFLGDRADVPRLMRAAEIFCQPNAAPEPFGIVFIEALGAGLPIVATAMGGAREIIDDRTGVLAPPDDVAAIAGALRRLIENPAERDRLGGAGPRRAFELCDPATQMARLETLLLRFSEAVGARFRAASGAIQ